MSKSSSSVVRHYSWSWRKILALFFAILIVVNIPVIIVLLSGLWLYRAFVGLLAKLLRPDLAGLMSLGSTPFSTDLIYCAEKPKIPLILAITLKGRLDLNVFRRAVTKLVNDKDEKGNPKHPELQQSVIKWFGFIFWKWDTHFRVENHVNIYEEYAKRSDLNSGDLLDISNKIMSQKFDPNRSPWEFLILHNYKSPENVDKSPQTAVILRTHHCLGDGFSLLKLFLVDMSGETLKTAKPVPYSLKVTTPQIGLCQRVIQGLCFPFRMAHELLTGAVGGTDINEWHVPQWRMKRKINGGMSSRIPLEYVKKIKNAHGVSFTAVPLAAFSGGIRNFMMERGLGVPPDGIHCLLALPYPGHPWKLRNHLSGAFIKLPLDLPTARERVKAIEQSLIEIKGSTVPLSLFCLLKLGGLPPAYITFLCFRNLITTALNSNFPGPAVETKFVGLPIQDCAFAVGFGSGNSAIGLGSLSYNGDIRLAAGFDEAVLPPHIPFDKVMAKIVDELKVLEEEAPKNVTFNIKPKDLEDLNYNIKAPDSYTNFERAIKKQI